MKRRRLVALVSVAVLFALGIAAVSVLLIATRTDFGHEQLRKRLVEPLVAGGVHGSIHIGRLGGNLLDSVTFDTLAIRDTTGALFLSTGKVTVKFDPRDFWDRRIYVRRADVEHPFVHIVERASGKWNFHEIFGSQTPGPKRSTTSRSWGSYIVLDSVRARQGKFLLSLRWHPDDSLRGAKRDSALRYNLARADHDIDRTADGFKKKYTWSNIYALLSHARIADPDSDTQYGRLIELDTLHADEFDPPFNFRNVQGVVHHLGDSVWFEARHFDLPASTGAAHGKVVWGSGLPVRYDITVRGDSVALNDVGWVYPTLPRNGGGSMMLQIKNDPRNSSVLDFKLTKMDVRSTKSHLLGSMSFGIGSPVLLVRDLDLKADPVDFDLVRTLNGKPFPVDWQGQLFGTVKGRGGPLTHFMIDDARATWRDTHVPGAESRFAGRGELDILFPAFTAFHGFNVDVGSLDLRSIEYLYPAFPRLRGTIAGTARLDSSWLDVRFSNADVRHYDGPGEPSHLTGSGRVTYGDPFMIYDVSLNAEPLSLTALARSYPGLPFRGLVSGPIRAKGTSPDLELVTSLQGSGGALSFEGRVDVDSIGGYGAHGRGNFSGLDVVQLLERATIPVGTLSGKYDVDLVGATAADLRGRAELDIDRTVFDSVRIYPSHATLRFAEGRMFVDSMQLRTAAGTGVIRGAIGLPKGPSDSSLSIVLNVDSLGGLRRYLGRFVVTPSGETVPDSLGGRLVLTAKVRGRLDSLDASGNVTGSELFIRGTQGLGLVGTFDVKNALTAPSGTLVFHGDSLRLAGIALDSLGATVNVVDRNHATFVAAGGRADGPAMRALGELTVFPGGQSVRLDSLGLDIGEAHWKLASPARLTADSTGLSIDSILVRNADSAVIALSGVVPNAGSVDARLRAIHIPLTDIAELTKYSAPLSGLADFAMQVGGTKLKPEITATAAFTGMKTGSLAIDRIATTGGYRDGRFSGDLDLYLKGQNALRATAMVPLNLTLFEAHVPKDPVHITLRTDSVDLSIVELFMPRTVDNAKGRLALNVDMSGRWGPRDSLLASLAPTGTLTVENGRFRLKPLNVTFANVHADVRLSKNALTVADVSMTSLGGRPNNSLQLKDGTITNPFAPSIRTYDLTLRAFDFLAMDRKTRARLSVSTGSTPLRLTGTGNAVSLTGGVLVDHSQLYLPDPALARKQLVDIDVDTAAGGLFGTNRSGAILNKLGLRNAAVTVNLGDDVKLKSNQADVRLAGSLVVGMQRSVASGLRTGGRDEPQYLPTVDGELIARGGTYTLDLGLVRRDFTVTDGRVRFDGNTIPPNPDVDISAVYNVKRYKQQDIGVIVHVKGPLVPGPTIDFSSNQPYEISQSDLVSYLVTGEPGFDALASNPYGLQTVATVLAPTASSLLTSGLRQSLGSWVDIVQFQGAVSGDRTTTGLNTTTFGDFFAGGSLSAQTQFGPNLFFSVSAGLCQFDPRGANRVQNQSALDAFGGKLEYRFKPDLSLQTGREPSTQARYCGSGPLLGTVGTPSQWSLSLLKSWRF